VNDIESENPANKSRLAGRSVGINDVQKRSGGMSATAQFLVDYRPFVVMLTRTRIARPGSRFVRVTCSKDNES